METNEFRLGNIVTRTYWNPEPKNERYCFESCTITFISGSNINISPIGKKVKFRIAKKNITPMQLTEEWLKKLGFKPFQKDWSIKGLIVHSRKRGFIVRKSIPQLEYVHELQNLYFALTGKELQFEANKT